MKKRVTFILFIIFAYAGVAQKSIDYDKVKAFNIVVNTDDYTVKTQILKDSKDIKPQENLTYNWYSANKLLETRGGFDGKLLHGYYKCFYLSDNLKESGEFDYGLKNNKWMSWYPNGVVRDVIHWKKGVKNGKYRLYNEAGELVAEGNFKNDQLDGKFKTYVNGKLASEKKYKKGVEVLPPPKKEKHKKVKKDNSEEVQANKPQAKQKVKFKDWFRSIFHKSGKTKENTENSKGSKKKKEETAPAKKEKKKKKKSKPEDKPATITT